MSAAPLPCAPPPGSRLRRGAGRRCRTVDASAGAAGCGRRLSVRHALGLPCCPGASADPGGAAEHSDGPPGAEGAQAAAGGARKAPLKAAGPGRSLASQAEDAIKAAPCAKEPDSDHVAELLSWTQSWRRDLGAGDTMSQLLVEIQELGQEWSAYDGGRCDRRAALEVLAGGAAPPKGPLRTAQAASLLMRVVRCLPARLPLRGMLEPLVHEMLEAAYPDWRPLASLAEAPEAELTVERLLRLAPHHALAAALRARAEDAAARAAAAAAEAAGLRCRAGPLEAELAEAREAARAGAGELAEERRRREEAERQLAGAEEALARVKGQTRHALADFAEVQLREQTARADLRNMLRDRQEKASSITELQGQMSKLTHKKHELEEELHQALEQLEKREAETRQLPRLREQLSFFERQEGVYGLGFATRIAQEVFETSLEDLCAGSCRQSPLESPRRKETKAVLDAVCRRLKELRAEIEDLKSQVQRLRSEVSDTRQLVPIWNAGAAQDLEEAYSESVSPHRQVFSMKDQRAFAGLGLGVHVPPYLKAEGLVRHIFVAKAELEDFMASFHDHLFSEERSGSEISSEVLHAELHQHLKKRYEGDGLIEFAYAFICGLDAHRDDPDFELFDLMLSGAVHPSIVQDQQRMLRELQTLVRSCQEAQVEDAAPGAPGARPPSRGASVAAAGLQQREYVSRRVLRAALQAVFPEKTAPRQNALGRALHGTLQTLADRARTPSSDSAFISDLFAANMDGGQSPLIEEIRRQHYHEVVEFTSELTRRLGARAREGNGEAGPAGSGARMVEGNDVRSALKGLDPQAKPGRIEELAAMACGEAEGPVPLAEALRRLRHGTLLRPEQLWVRAQPKDVVTQLLAVGPPDAAAPSDAEKSQGPAEVRHGHLARPRRNRALKVLDNPLAKMRSELYDTPEGLQRAVLHDRHEAGAEPADGEPPA